MIRAKKDAIIEPCVQEISIKIPAKSLSVISHRFLYYRRIYPTWCVRHFKIRGVKAGFALLYDGIRHILITHGRTIRYVYTCGVFLSLFLIRSLFLARIFPEKLPSSLWLARRFVRARMNSDLSWRWERACSSQDLFRGRTPIWRRNGKKRGGGCFNSKINTYSRDFITDGHVRSMRGRIMCTTVQA